MSRGRSKAHEYNARGECIYCGMYRCNVEAFGHVCTYERECLFEEIEKGKHRNITGFTAKLESHMPFAAGATAVIDFTPVPAGAKPAPGDVPTLTSSDPTNAPVTADATGLVATVNFSATAPAGSYTITCSYTNPDGVVATPGTYTGTIEPPPPPDITGFTATLVS